MSPRLFILGHTTPSKLSYNLYILYYCRCSGNHIAGNVKAINLMLTFFIYFRWLYELPFMRFAMLRSQSITFFPISFFGRLMSKTTWNPLPVQFMTRSNEMLILMINGVWLNNHYSLWKCQMCIECKRDDSEKEQ